MKIATLAPMPATNRDDFAGGPASTSRIALTASHPAKFVSGTPKKAPGCSHRQ